MAKCSDIELFTTDSDTGLSIKSFSSEISSGTESSGTTEGSDSEAFMKRIFRKKKLPKPSLRRSSRQGMCLLTSDESQSEPEESKKISVKETQNLVEMEDDPILEDFIKNYN